MGALRHDLLPTLLKIEIGGFYAPSCWLELDGSDLVYRHRDYRGTSGDEAVRVTPSKEQWETFWQSLEDLDVWKWAKRYDNPLVLDGTQWSVHIEHGQRKVNAFGSNAYPGMDAACEEEKTDVFRRFCESVSLLLGGLGFG